MSDKNWVHFEKGEFRYNVKPVGLYFSEEYTKSLAAQLTAAQNERDAARESRRRLVRLVRELSTRYFDLSARAWWVSESWGTRESDFTRADMQEAMDALNKIIAAQGTEAQDA